MKLWDKGTKINNLIESFTVGKDPEMDFFLAKFDVIGSLAHIQMLEHIGLLQKEELTLLSKELKNIYLEITEGNFVIEEGVEDIHSQIELMLTNRLGETGKKIHSGRSRNDQVLLDLKLFTRDAIRDVTENCIRLFNILITQSNKYKAVLMPGYTHLQVAMPSSFGLWFSAYAESLTDDLMLLHAAYRVADQNPLGSAAGYGSSFPLNRQMTTDLLGFETMNFNVVYAQMGRGKMERTVLSAMASIAATISRLAYDVCLFMSQNFGFVKLPDELTTGSSIMPHKKNPDVFELLRAHCNKIQALPAQMLTVTNNLPSGYFRDMQLIKELYIPAFQELNDCIGIAAFAIENITVNEHILEDDKYRYLYSVEEVNRLVLAGTPFRDAYREVGAAIEKNQFNPTKEIHHTHEGSIGNLCLDSIQAKMDQIVSQFNFEKASMAIETLLQD
ncbi:MAG: argininosuccinate lyase [Prolixibacteraceae bacterium]|jgi:argininosuccinate lyase|nr:argininosuccinate lyase [Prolixibacteraceae bacterium]